MKALGYEGPDTLLHILQFLIKLEFFLVKGGGGLLSAGSVRETLRSGGNNAWKRRNEVDIILRRRNTPCVEHWSHKGINNRAENSHLPVRRRERRMMRFKSVR